MATCLVLLLSLGAAAQLNIVPTTTLTAETANNTSASSTFSAQTNGNAGAGNVSKLSIRQLLYAGSTTKIYAHVVPWFGKSDHMSVGYNSSDPAEIHAQVDDMLSRGIQGVVIDWYGPNAYINSTTALNYMTESNSRGGAFEFSIMVDVGALNAYAQQNGCDVTQQLIDDLTYVANTFYVSPAYTKVGSRPVVTFFAVDSYYIDWDKVRASVPGNPLFIKRNPSGFSASQSDGAFAWVEINRSDPNDMMLSYLDTFYTAAEQYPSELTIGATYKGFNDTLAGWGSNRIVSQQCGRTWLSTFAELNKYYSSSNPLPALQLVTWNDYEEATELETGIDNCVSLAATVSGSTLGWDIGGAARESTLDHYTVFISTDGQNLMKLADVAAGTHSLDLAQYNLAPGTYVLYVKAIGQPSIVNHISNAAAFNPNDQPPVASLSVSPTSGAAPLAVTASGTASSDPDGSITLSQIDFGDGTVVSGLTATHTYQTAGNYTITLTVTDNGGVFASTSAKVSVAAGPGVTITSPSDGATLSSPVHVTATAIMTGGVSYMEALIDGVIVYSTPGSSINTYLKVSAGTHELRVAAHDPTGAYITSQITIYVATNDIPPTANLTVNPFGAGNGVMACTATSTDSDGWVTSSWVDFGDGANGSGPTAFHTYASAGTYTVTATVEDNQGVTSSTSSQVTVGSSASCPVSTANQTVTICTPADGATTTSPVHIVARANDTNPVLRMEIWIDGVKMYSVAGASIDTSLALSTGQHRLAVVAAESDTFYYKTVEYITVATTAAPTVQLTASPTTITAGQTATLTWSSTNATSVSIAGIGTFGASGSTSVQPSATTTYTATATGPGGTASGSTTVTVQAAGGCALSTVNKTVTICSPAAGSTVSSPIHVVAGVTDSTAVIRMEIWVDGTKTYSTLGNSIDTSLPLNAGYHRFVVVAVESSTSYFSAVEYITVGQSSSGCVPGGVNQTITICSPADASTVGSPVHVLAASTDSTPVIRMEVWVDGVKMYSTAGSSVDTSLPLSSGTHRIVVVAAESNTSYFKSVVYATVSP